MAGLGLALAVAWAGDPLLAADSPAARIGTLALAAFLAGCSLGLLIWSSRRQQNQANRCLQALTRLAPQDLFADTPAEQLPILAPHHPQASAIAGLREALSGHLRRIQELEHARAAAEVRCRRAIGQYEQIRAIFSYLAEPILAVDDYNELLLANRSAEELFGFESGKVEDRALARVVHCQRLVDLLAGTASRKSPGSRTEELEITDAQGRTRWYRATAVKLSAGDGPEPRCAAAQGAVAVLRDIADHKALQKRNAEFVSAVSHEMKTPLAGIKAYVELLADGEAEDRATQEEFLQLISSQADRLQRLVENLLNIARIEAGVVNVNKQPRSLNEILEEALRLVQPSAEGKNIQLTAELSPMYLGVLADRDMLLQAVLNLLSNAVKYTPQGGKVILRSHTDGQQIRFEVQDTGVGLSEEDCKRVFEKFYRVKKDRDMAPGTGLGLPLAKHIVEDVHGGTITVQSKLGEGSTFSVILPRAGQSL